MTSTKRGSRNERRQPSPIMAHETKATIYQTDGWFMALCNDFPGVTGQGRTRDECIADLTRNIEAHVDQTHPAPEPSPASGG